VDDEEIVRKHLKLEEIRYLTQKSLEPKRLLEENRQPRARPEPLEGRGEQNLLERAVALAIDAFMETEALKGFGAP
jgi:hypothetical protein